LPDIAARLAAVRARLAAAVESAGRDPASVRLLAASKTRTPADLRSALAAGQHLLGENRAQELRDKGNALEGEDIEWHFIGPLQKNKIKYVVGRARMIHSIDSLALAEAIDARIAQQKLPPIEALIQVNIGDESSKSGVPAAEALALVQAVDALPGLSVRGLMTIPPPVENPTDAAPYFDAMVALAAAGRAAGLPLDELSMGMSHDLEVAVAHGATIVRVGTAIFGPRR
jgi:pyridoxal phosphate enzyme (YggS family)